MRILAPLAAFLCWAPLAYAEGLPPTMDAAGVPNYVRIRPAIGTGGQPTDDGLKRLKEAGFKTVVNLRTEAEGASAEADKVKALGMRYVPVPISRDTFSVADAEAVGRVLAEEAARPVFVHCASGSRVGAVWTVLEVRRGTRQDHAPTAVHRTGGVGRDRHRRRG